MNLRQQLINDRVAAISDSLKLPQDTSFLRLVHSIVTGQSIHAFDLADLVDGGQDKQVDTLTIIQNDEEANVFILSGKNSGTFSSNALIQMANGLDWIFNKSKNDLKTLANAKLRDRINDLRSVLSGLGFANVEINVVFATNGLTAELSPEFQQEYKHIVERYDNGSFGRFTFEAWGADELVTQINALEKRNRKIDANIPIRYDANNPSLIKYHAEGLKGLVCSTSAREIARLVLNDATGSIFDSNVRRFLGTRGAVNGDILRTCTDTGASHQFWFLNNGITVTCDSFDPVTDPDNPHVKVKNMQIVNGCQTATALAIAEKDGKLATDVRVLLRIYEAADSQLIDRIVLMTNNQNKISSRDLRSNDKVQIDMEEGFRKYDYFYERKVNQWANVPSERIIVNETVAQSCLAVILKKPSDARRRKYKVWGELYEKIFTGQAVEPYVIATLLFRTTNSWLVRSGLVLEADDTKRKLANNGAFHVARIAAHTWRGSDNWNVARKDLQAQIELIEKNPQGLDEVLDHAFSQLEALIRANLHYLTDIDNALKSNTLEADLDRALYGKKVNDAAPVASVD